jgi:translocation and assembly module TamB
LASEGGVSIASSELALEGDALALVDPRLQALLGVAPKLDVRVSGGAHDGWSAEDILVVGSGIRADGGGRFDVASEKVDAELAFTLSNLESLGEVAPQLHLAGAIDGKVAIDGVRDALKLRTTLEPKALRIGASPQLAGSLELVADGSTEAASGSVAADLSVGGTPLRANGKLRYARDADLLGIDALTIVSSATTVDATGELLLAPQLAKGKVNVTSKDISTLASLVDLEARGRLAGRLELSHDGRAQAVRYTADASDLVVAGVADAAVVAATVAVEGELRDVTGRRDGRLDARATRVRWQDLDLAALDLDAERKSGTTSFRADASGHYRGELALQFSGRQTGDLERGSVTVDRVQGKLRSHVVASTAPLELQLRDREVAVRRLALAVDSGRIEGEWSGGGLRGVGSIRANELPLELAALVVEGSSLGGRLSGEVSRRTRGEDLVVRAHSADLLLSSSDTAALARPIALDLSARGGAWRSHVEARVVSAADASTLTVDANLPFGFIGGRTGAPLGGSIRGTLTPDLVDDLVLPDNERLDGKLDVDLALGGTLEAPLFDGRAGGQLRYTSGTTGMELTIDEIELRASGRTIEVVTLRGSDGRKGRLHGEGRVDLARGGAPTRYDLALSFKDTVIAKLDSVDLRGDGALALRGAGDELVLGGNFGASEATLRIPNSLPPDVVTLSVEHVNLDASRSAATVVEEPAATSPIKLDLAIDFPGRLRVEDPNLDSEWRGQLFVRGDTAKPDVQGELVAVRGRFDLAGIRFDTTEGKLTFEKETNVPLVDITMVADRHEIEATMRLQGPADRPSINLTSVPALPQDEILSRLMFGESAGTLTPGQSIQLAQAAARLSGRGPGLSSTLIARVRRLAGVDRIEIKDSGDTTQATTAVSVGKYIGDRVYVSYDQALHGEGSKARVEVEMTKHISAETEVGQSENASVGLRWRWNY